MFTVLSPYIEANPVCEFPINAMFADKDSARYFDKDGFELCSLEKMYYENNGFPVNDCLNHRCWQEDWIKLDSEQPFYLDHAIVLHRASFDNLAKDQLTRLSEVYPTFNFLLQTKKKWGIDFALDFFHDGEMYEVIHNENDFYNFDDFLAYKAKFEEFIMTTDWLDASHRLIKRKDEWLALSGFAQNDWKARYFGFQRAEITQKVI